MKKNERKQPPARCHDPHRAGVCGEKKDYVLDLPEMDEQKILAIAWIGTGRPTGVNVSAAEVADAKAQLEEIVRRCNQFVPQVMRYKRLLDQFDREVIRPEIEAKKGSRKDARAQDGKKVA